MSMRELSVCKWKPVTLEHSYFTDFGFQPREPGGYRSQQLRPSSRLSLDLNKHAYNSFLTALVYFYYISRTVPVFSGQGIG
jgi:hypothetical protein